MSCLYALSLVVPAMILHVGLYLDMFLADLPDFVTITIAVAFKSIAVVQAAWHTASGRR